MLSDHQARVDVLVTHQHKSSLSFKPLGKNNSFDVKELKCLELKQLVVPTRDEMAMALNKWMLILDVWSKLKAS